MLINIYATKLFVIRLSCRIQYFGVTVRFKLYSYDNQATILFNWVKFQSKKINIGYCVIETTFKQTE